MKTNRAEALIALCDIAELYYEASKGSYGKEFLTQILGLLLDCESIVDHSRGVPLFEDDQAPLADVHLRLDALREHIHELMARMGEDTVAAYLESRILDKQSEYSRVAQKGTAAL